MFHIDVETPADAPAIEDLLDLAFGSDRHTKTSYSYRVGVEPIDALSRVARRDGRLVGTIRYWPLMLADAPALLLGPLGVDPALRGIGIGRALLRTSLALIERAPRPVLLVGDPSYYAPLGFVPAAPKIEMPGEKPERLMVLGSLESVPSGRLQRWSTSAAPAAPAPA